MERRNLRLDAVAVVHLVDETTQPGEREKPKWQIHKGESTDASQGADRSVVATKPRNGGRAKRPGCS
jgi:hypothetical protein